MPSGKKGGSLGIIKKEEHMTQQTLTGAEKVLWKAEYNFAIEILKMSDREAREKADLKIVNKRKLVKVLPRY